MSAAQGNSRRVGNLPAETTTLVGRSAEIARVRSLLERERLVTLTGPGGVGKSRLALRVAAEAAPGFPDGVWWVALSPLEGPALLAHTVSETVELADQTARPMIDVLTDYLARRRLLLVLDTCEHLAGECALTVEALLAAAPGLRVLATSRAALEVPGERVQVVGPLPVPADAAARGDEAAAGHDDAVTLFTDRAAGVVPGFRVDAANWPTVAGVCRKLDGIPLAVELAAARLRDLSLEQLATRLGDRFELLGEVANARPARHRTLRSTVGWSHELCTPPERLLWARLSVFAGGFDGEAAGQVCSDHRLPEIGPPLAGLVEKSIVTRVGVSEPHYRMLDTIRAYGAEWLRNLGEEFQMRRRHRDYYRALAQQGSAEWLGPDQFAWYDRLIDAHGNLRAALDFSLAGREGHAALDLAGSLWFFWHGCGFAKEGRHYLGQALASDGAPSPERVRALWACGLIAASQGDPDTADSHLAECATAAEGRGDAKAAAHALAIAAATAGVRGDLAGAVAASERVLSSRDDDLSLDMIVASLTRAHAHTVAGEVEEAIAVLERMRADCDAHGERWWRSLGDVVRAQAELSRGRAGAAQHFGRAALKVKHRLHDSAGVAMAVDLLASAAAATGEAERAARLLGLAQQVWDTFGVAQIGVPEWVAARQICEKQARNAIGDHAYETAFRAGFGSALDAGIAYALSEPDAQPHLV